MFRIFKKNLFLLILSLFFLIPTPAYAHAFGQQYVLPVPFWLYAYGAASAVIISFVIVGFFVKETKKKSGYPTKDITGILNFAQNRAFLNIVKAISVLLLIITILSGLFGIQDPTANFNMTFFWIIFYLGIAYISALFGDIYATLNPWKIISEKFFSNEEKIFQYPKKLGYCPALLFYFLFVWIELVGRVGPYGLSLALVIYSVISFLGAYSFGYETWFRYGDFFSVFYRLLGNLSIVEKKGNKFYLRPPFVGVLNKKVEHFSIVLFVLFMLSSTAFDGFRETQSWWDLYFNALAPVQNLLGDNAPAILSTLGLIAAPLVFLSLYLLLIWLMKVIVGIKTSFKDLVFSFAFSLIPIALVYNIAHYYTLLAIQGQAIISLISDPLGIGWNLFHTKDFLPNIGLISVNSIWHSQVLFILVGHIAAVYLAHIVAIETFPTHRKAILSQFPMLALMVAYTVAGLWILSQPLTSGF